MASSAFHSLNFERAFPKDFFEKDVPEKTSVVSCMCEGNGDGLRFRYALLENQAMHQYKCWNIDWDITDEDVDDNGLPLTAKDLGLPAWDEEVIVELDDDEVEDGLSA